MKKLKLDELGRISVDQFKEIEKIPVCILLDNVRSMHNVGSAFRSADAFRIEKIFLTGITGTPPHREIQKTALGATESIAWEYISDPEDAVIHTINMGYTPVMIEQTTASMPLHEFLPEPDKKYCLVFGNEVNGISEKVLTHGEIALEIPQAGTKHSLNIAVCLGIVSWEFFRKMKLVSKI